MDSPLNTRSVDELLRVRATSHPDAAVIGYPAGPSSGEYRYYSLSQLNRFAYRVACTLEQSIRNTTSGEPRRSVGLLGPASLDHVVHLLALIKLGHTAVIMSPRLSDDAYAHLMDATGCVDVLVHPSFVERMTRVGEIANKAVNVVRLLTMDEYDLAEDHDGPQSVLNKAWKEAGEERDQPVWVLHSSGSTGLPKPIYKTVSRPNTT